MSTTTYYISYEQPRRPPWRLLLLILLTTVALGLLGGIAYGIYALVSADSPPERELEPLRDVLMSIHRTDDTATFLLPDITTSVDKGADVNLQEELLSVLTATPDAPGYSPNPIAVASLAQVKKNPSVASEFHSLADPTAQAHLARSVAVPPADRPSFIYDAIAEAYRVQGKAQVAEGNRAIVVLTDGIDGGYLVVDPAELALCPPDIPAGPDEVCAPLTITIPVDPAELRACPSNLPVAHSDVACMPVGDASDAYYPVDPADVTLCPDGPPGRFCADIVVDYEPIDPGAVGPCPPALEDVPPGQACVDLRSELQLDALLAMLVNGDPLVTVHTIGLGDPEDHDNLKLIAEATGGDYYRCTRRGCLRPD